MKVVVLDTNILINNVHGYARWLDKVLEHRNQYTLVVPTIVVAEYFASQEVETKEGLLETENYLSLFKKQDLTEDIAHELGKILRRKTYVSSAGTVDLVAAATAIHLDAELATRNKKDFAKIPDLRFFDPEKLKD